jgi:hypothetical protein
METGVGDFTPRDLRMFFFACDRWSCDEVVDYYLRGLCADPDRIAYLVKLYRDQFDGD